jgi:hypothetical protein
MFIDHSRVDMRRAGHTHIDCSICNFDLKRDYSLAGIRVLKRLQSCLALRWDLASPNMLTLSLTCFTSERRVQASGAPHQTCLPLQAYISTT